MDHPLFGEHLRLHNTFQKDFEIFADSELYQDACYSKINQITQCLDRIAVKDPEFFEASFSFSVGSIKGIRNIIPRQYESVDNRIVWRFVTEEIPVWESDARKALDKMENIQEPAYDPKDDAADDHYTYVDVGHYHTGTQNATIVIDDPGPD